MRMRWIQSCLMMCSMRSGATPEMSYLEITSQGWDSDVVGYIHDGVCPSLELSSSSDMISNFVPLIANGLIALLEIALTEEPLQERAVHAMQRHPMEMPLHGLWMSRREQIGLLS